MVGPGGRAPLTDACALPFRLLKILFLEHHSSTRQHTMMEKGIITVRPNIILLGRFLDSLRNCWQSTAVSHKSDAIFRLISTPLRMCREREMQA